MDLVLIVDDEQDEINVISYLLNQMRVKVSIFYANNGMTALKILKNEKIDLLITDIQMPFMNGIELSRQAKIVRPMIEIIFFSGYNEFEYAKQAISIKAINYILKPINPKEFENTIYDAIKHVAQKKNEYSEFEDSIEQNFYSHSEKLPSSHDSISSLEDNQLLSEIRKALQLYHYPNFEKNVLVLLDKYAQKKNVSHIYIRYILTTLMRYIFDALPTEDEITFQKAAEIIYCGSSFQEIRDYILTYLKKVQDHFTTNENATSYPVQVIEQYILENYAKDLSLQTLSNLVFLTPKYISDIFSQEKGISINKFIRNIRLTKAASLLLTSNRKISDISNSVGYPNVSYFCKIFNEEFGHSPELFRKERPELNETHKKVD